MAFIEAAHAAVIKSPRMRELFNKRTLNGTCHKNRGYVAVAHQLCVSGFACHKHACDYLENPPPRPGTRPIVAVVVPAVQGQPEVAMANPRPKKPRIRPPV